jgi:hypothetical protein
MIRNSAFGSIRRFASPLRWLLALRPDRGRRRIKLVEMIQAFETAIVIDAKWT